MAVFVFVLNVGMIKNVCFNRFINFNLLKQLPLDHSCILLESKFHIRIKVLAARMFATFSFFYFPGVHKWNSLNRELFKNHQVPPPVSRLMFIRPPCRPGVIIVHICIYVYKYIFQLNMKFTYKYRTPGTYLLSIVPQRVWRYVGVPTRPRPGGSNLFFGFNLKKTEHVIQYIYILLCLSVRLSIRM